MPYRHSLTDFSVRSITFAVMKEPDFRFRQFSIRQDRCPMKVGTDGVLLGAWAPLGNESRILDIGTGTGLIALMAAQRNPAAAITAVEIDRSSAEQAAENVAMSPWHDRIAVICTDIRTFSSSERFDTILCNPPFFRNSLQCPDPGRNTARHDGTLSFEELLRKASELLADDGEFCVIIPSDAVSGFTGLAASAGLQMHRRTDVTTRAGAQPKRTLLSFGKKWQECESSILDMRDQSGQPSLPYRQLVNNFYLKIN